MSTKLGLTELLVGGAGILAVLAAASFGAFKSERSKRKAAESRARAQAGLAESEVIASKERVGIVAARDESLSKLEDEAETKKAAIDAEERELANSTLKDLADKFNTQFKSTPKSRRFNRRIKGPVNEGPKK